MSFNITIDLQVPKFPKHVTISVIHTYQQLYYISLFGQPLQHNTTVSISLETIKKLDWLENVKTISIYGSFGFFVHPHYAEIIETIRKKAPQAILIVYTSGLELSGKNLATVLKYATIIHITQNAISEKIYNIVTKNGNYKKSLHNLETLAALRSPNTLIQISMVATKASIRDIKNFIDFMAKHTFSTLEIKSYSEYSEQPIITNLGSPLCNLSKEININKLLEYAKKRNITVLLVNQTASGAYVCYFPYTTLLISPESTGKISLNYCYNGMTNISISEHSVGDIETVWNNERITFIRKTVNDRFGLIENKLCLSCRVIKDSWEEPKKTTALESIGVFIKDKFPTYFNPLHISLYLFCILGKVFYI